MKTIQTFWKTQFRAAVRTQMNAPSGLVFKMRPYIYIYYISLKSYIYHHKSVMHFRELQRFIAFHRELQRFSANYRARLDPSKRKKKHVILLE